MTNSCAICTGPASLYNNTLAHHTVTKDDDDVGLHEYSC